MWSWLLEALLPRRCALCRALSAGKPFCSPCAQTIHPSDGNVGYGGVLAGFAYTGGARAAILAAKFHPDQTRAEALIAHWVRVYREKPSLHKVFGAVDAVCFVPVHWRRRVLRGFDLSSLVARAVARCLNAPVLDALVCRRFDPSLSKAASRDERIKMTTGRYGLRVPAHAVAGKRLLLVDDVVTTGSTLRAAAVPLQQAHAEVYAFALAATTLRACLQSTPLAPSALKIGSKMLIYPSKFRFSPQFLPCRSSARDDCRQALNNQNQVRS